MDKWIKIGARHAMTFAVMNLGMAAYEVQRYYGCEPQNFTAVDHMRMAFGMMDEPRQLCPTLNDLEMIILGNLLKTGAMFAVDILVKGGKKVYRYIQEKKREYEERREVFYDALEEDEDRLPYLYDCIDNKRLPHYSVNHLFTVMNEADLTFPQMRYILAKLYAICLEQGEKGWGEELRKRAGRFFRLFSFYEFFPLPDTKYGF